MQRAWPPGGIGADRTSIAFIALILLAGFGCHETEKEPASMARQVEAESPARSPWAHDGRLRLVAAVAELPGEAVPLIPTEGIEIPDGAAIYLETRERLDDYRVRLVDDDERLVPFSLESGPVALRGGMIPMPGGTWIRLTPNASLRDDAIYRLRIESEMEENITDYQGRSYDDLMFEVRRVDRVQQGANPQESSGLGLD